MELDSFVISAVILLAAAAIAVAVFKHLGLGSVLGLLVDTPDTDSVASPAHHQLLHQVVARSDVLICVFDAQNPKRRDHIDFMAPLVNP